MRHEFGSPILAVEQYQSACSPTAVKKILVERRQWRFDRWPRFFVPSATGRFLHAVPSLTCLAACKKRPVGTCKLKSYAHFRFLLQKVVFGSIYFWRAFARRRLCTEGRPPPGNLLSDVDNGPSAPSARSFHHSR